MKFLSIFGPPKPPDLSFLAWDPVQFACIHGVDSGYEIWQLSADEGLEMLEAFTAGMSPLGAVIPKNPFKKECRYGRAQFLLKFYFSHHADVGFSVGPPNILLYEGWYWSVGQASWECGKTLADRYRTRKPMGQ